MPALDGEGGGHTDILSMAFGVAPRAASAGAPQHLRISASLSSLLKGRRHARASGHFPKDRQAGGHGTSRGRASTRRVGRRTRAPRSTPSRAHPPRYQPPPTPRSGGPPAHNNRSRTSPPGTPLIAGIALAEGRSAASPRVGRPALRQQGQRVGRPLARPTPHPLEKPAPLGQRLQHRAPFPPTSLALPCILAVGGGPKGGNMPELDGGPCGSILRKPFKRKPETQISEEGDRHQRLRVISRETLSHVIRLRSRSQSVCRRATHQGEGMACNTGMLWPDAWPSA